MVNKGTSIRGLLSGLLATLVLPLLGLATWSQYREVQLDLRRVEGELEGFADAAVIGIEQFLNSSERFLQALSADPDLRSLDPARCPGYFPSLQSIFIPTYTNLFTWNLGEEEVCSIVEDPASAGDVGGPPDLEEIKAAQDFHISVVHEGTTSKRWTTGLSYPLRDQDGVKTGVITLSVDLVRFQEILEGLNPGQDALLSVIQLRDTTVVARSKDAEHWVGRRPPPSTSPRDGGPPLGERGFTRSLSVEGEEIRWAYVRVSGTDWVVYAGRPTAEVYGPLYRRWIQSFFLTLFALGIVILLGRLIYRRISDPLAQMVEDAESAQPGDPSPLKAQGPREVAQVATRFNEAWGAWREAEDERHRSEQRIRSLVENAVTGIYISTRGGRFLEVNQAMVDLLGYDSRDELLGTPVSALYPSVDERLEILASHGQKEVFHGVEVNWRRKNGSSVAVRLFGRGISLPDGEEAWEVVVEDVTSLRSLQEQYLQSQKMEALGRLAGGIAHDFNNLLTVVQGQAELILEDPRVGEDLKHQVREIAQAADRGATLNRQLLAFARRGSDVGKIVDLNQILSDFALILRRAAGEEINLEFAPGHGLGSIRGDRGQLEQVMMNLVVNAKDAMPRGGDLLVDTYNTELDDEEAAAYPPAVPGPHVVLAVSDTGVGIDPEDLPSIFEPFFSTKPESQGTGLGLATVYGIVTELHGHIRVESEPGQGTTFRLFFPLVEGRPLDEAVSREETAEATGSGLILLAEDEEGVRRLTTRILERGGYKVISAADGRAALNLAMTYDGTLDLLVTDVVMPEMRGPELAEALARAGKVKRAVLFSGYPEGMREAGLRGLERWELLSKPFTSKDLLAAVRRAMEAEV